MPISISSEVLGTLSVTIAETTGTLSVSVLATAPAVLSAELGTPGPAATIAIGTVTALAPDATPTVVNSGTNLNAVLDFGFPSGSTTQVRAQVRNETGATLTKGTVVYINGGAGNKVTVTKAIATGDATSAQTFGIVITDITNNQNGYVCVLGLVENLNTSATRRGREVETDIVEADRSTRTREGRRAREGRTSQGCLEVEFRLEIRLVGEGSGDATPSPTARGDRIPSPILASVGRAVRGGVREVGADRLIGRGRRSRGQQAKGGEGLVLPSR